MQPVVLTDTQDTLASDEHIDIHQEGLVAFLDTDLCLDVCYAVVGCVLAYIMTQNKKTL